jgi:hypothetical protein
MHLDPGKYFIPILVQDFLAESSGDLFACDIIHAPRSSGFSSGERSGARQLRFRVKPLPLGPTVRRSASTWSTVLLRSIPILHAAGPLKEEAV